MVTTRYLGGADGAPPLPPPGGYRGERRFSGDPFSAAFVAPQRPAAAAVPRRSTHPLGWIALFAAILNAIVLIAAAATGSLSAITGTTALVFQLGVAAVIIAALFIGRARVLGAVGLTIVLLINVGTAGAAAAIVADATGSYEGSLTPERQAQLAYPGIAGMSPEAILAAPSLEHTERLAEVVSEELRNRLSEEFGVTWYQVSDADSRYVRNGYGGESLLQRWASPVWRTEQPVQDYDTKIAMMRTVDAVLLESDSFWALQPLNEPGWGLDDRALEGLYGSADPRQQSTWEWAARGYDGIPGGPSGTIAYAMVTDLSNDDTGDVRAGREAIAAPGAPIEGFDLLFYATERLSENDVDLFRARLSGDPVS
ncbi:hypothetical protein [Microbacterium amylolyticum]|uniref:Uncharacterized protein n=1 Tax=Microbacterium amylolyticum TaxID=936337 RepID=A0ABS4ZI10_9MICO|nr:hypothetical protein [Microbacterium amylolyticum]MBP2436915.1 hypothetical protein [Microbacterium amylolyticum]